jgi:hypothetical protein
MHGVHESPITDSSQPPDPKNYTTDHNMALPTGNGEFLTPEDSKERSYFAPSMDSFDAFSKLLARLMPAPVVPRLTEKVLMSNHLKELNAVLMECSLATEVGFAPGAESRCRVAIGDSFSKFPDIARQVSLWFGYGISWSQIQADLVKSYASPREVSEAYSRALSALVFGPTFAVACRDLYVIYYSVFESHPHRMIDFVQIVCSKLPTAIRERVMVKLSREADDEYWQLSRPFWSPDDSHSIIGLIEENIRSDACLKDFQQSVLHARPRHVNAGHGADKVHVVSEQQKPKSSASVAPLSTSAQGFNARDNAADNQSSWAESFSSVWVVEPKRNPGKLYSVISSLREKSLSVKGPLMRKGKLYVMAAFQDDTTARNILRTLFDEQDFRPFLKNV